MGETDEKDTAPPTATEKGTIETPTEVQEPEPDPKETEKLLANSEEKTDDKETEKPADAEQKKKSSSENVNGTGEEIINIPDETSTETAKADDEKKSDKPNKVQAEEREVKPKKVPAGAFKLPGFFNKSKAKEADGADNELLEKQETDKEPKAAEAAEDKPKRAGFFASLKLRNPFAKKQPEPNTADDTKTKPEEEENDEVTAEATDKKPDEETPANETTTTKEEEAGVAAPKKGLLDALKVPLASIIPKRFKSGGTEGDDDLELGKRPKNRAGLASMETLDDSLKDTETKDTVDKPAAVAAGPNGTDSEALVKPEEKKDAEKDDGEEPTPSKYPCLERFRTYKCSVGE